MRRLRNAEIVDDLQLTRAQREGKHADVFFNGRLVIGEVKLLATDTAGKIAPIFAPYENSPEWPIFYGERPLSKILEFLPEREKIERAVFNAVAGSLEYLVRDANRQIRATKASFALPNARGILVVLNDTIDILDPNVMAHKFGQTLLKKDADGNARYPHVEYVWLLCETHTTPIGGSGGSKGLLSVTTPNPRLPNDSDLDRFMKALQRAWADFNGMPMYETTMPIPEMQNMPLQPVPKAPEPTQITRSELWRREYRANPHLRPLSREEFLDVGNDFMNRAAKMFAPGAPALTEEQMIQFGRESAALFEEIEVRNIDMRELAAHAKRQRSNS